MVGMVTHLDKNLIMVMKKEIQMIATKVISMIPSEMELTVILMAKDLNIMILEMIFSKSYKKISKRIHSISIQIKYKRNLTKLVN